MVEDGDMEIDVAGGVSGIMAFSTTGAHLDANYARVAFRTNSGTRIRSRRPITGVTEFWFHGNVNVLATLTLNTVVWSARSRANSDTDQFRLIYSSSPNTFQFQRNNSGSFVSLGSAFTIGLNALRTWDIRCKIDGSAGEFEFYVDGSLVASFTGAALQTQHNIVDSFSMTTSGGGGDGGGTLWSEMVVADESTIGWRVKTIVATGAGNHTDFSNTFAAIDESTTIDLADFAASNTTNHVSTYAMSNINAGDYGREIKAVVVTSILQKSADSTPTDAQVAVRSGGTTATSASLSLNVGRTDVQTIFATNPVTSSTWAASDVDAVEIGVKAV